MIIARLDFMTEKNMLANLGMLAYSVVEVCGLSRGKIPIRVLPVELQFLLSVP